MKHGKRIFRRAVYPAAVILLSLCLLVCGGRPARNMPAAAAAQGMPPAGLAVAATPQFVCVASDDNGYSGLPGSGKEGGPHRGDFVWP